MAHTSWRYIRDYFALFNLHQVQQDWLKNLLSQLCMHLQRWYQVLSFMLSLLGRSSPYHTYRSSLALRNRHIYQQMSSAVDNGSTIVSNAIVVKERALSAAFSVGRSPETIRLVAVSKTKPADNIKELYDAGFRAFGENYFQELVEKAQTLPKDIKWHFIGHLQSSKASKLIKEVPNLAVLETVDSAKLAGKLNNACVQAGRPSLDVFIQVDTSGEETKSGVTAGAELDELLQLVRDSCPRLRVAGLMTIGAY